MSKFPWLTTLLSVTAIIILLLFPNQCIMGASDGLLLWYNKVLPVLLPFFIISSLICTRVSFSPFITTFFLGLLCGYPMGAKNVRDYYIQGYFSKTTAEKLMTVCNHASPMFLIGYVCTMQLNNSVPIPIFLFAIYFPYILLCCFYLLQIYLKKNTTAADSIPAITKLRKNITLDDSIEQSLVLICKIGCYIMLYSILCHLLLSLGVCLENKIEFPPLLLPFLTGILEMTNGISLVAGTDAPSLLKIVLITIIASFGGFSSMSQTKSAIKGTTLSMVPYVICKMLCGLMSGIIILVYLLILV